MVKIDKANYQIYKKVFEIFWKHRLTLMRSEASMLGLNINTIPSPIDILNESEQKSMSIALKGLKASYTDMFSMLRDAPRDFLTALDDDLKAHGLPGCFTLYAEVKDTLQKVLTRGIIRTTADYDFIVEILNDTTLPITFEEREVLNSCIVNFELKQPVRIYKVHKA